ncbi:MAG TPA: VWA domain-containing protein, partial [Gemmatimonadaceae bacterium]|nr:VWA domain-containing protein [Gemmatimonadaceae bacterium]
LRPEDSLALIFFSDGALTAHGFTTNREWSHKAIDDYRTAGGTALYDALASGLTMLKGVAGRRAMVVMTDGRDENNAGTAPGSRGTLADVLNLASQVEATILPIGLGTKIARTDLVRLAEISGGQAYFPAEVSELREQFARTLENLRYRYVVAYTSTNLSRDGSWRDVEIRSRSADVIVRSRSGYFAPDR